MTKKNGDFWAGREGAVGASSCVRSPRNRFRAACLNGSLQWDRNRSVTGRSSPASSYDLRCGIGNWYGCRCAVLGDMSPTYKAFAY
ncbi:MAG: hypothetical protein ACI3V2_07365 [Faecousia sp.]